jgi:hypothetical protein
MFDTYFFLLHDCMVGYRVVLCRVPDSLIFLSYPRGQLITGTNPAESESFLDIFAAIIKGHKIFTLY